jgi:hypothetical protein
MPCRCGWWPLNSRPAGYAEAVYEPVWQLLSGIQTVLDECDQQDAAQAKLSANAAARYEAEVTPAAQQEGDATGPEEDIAAAAVKTLLKIKKLLKGLVYESRDLSAALQDSKQAATAAASGPGRGVAAVDVATAAAQLLQPMLKALKRADKAKAKLQERLAAAVRAVADIGDHRNSSSSSSMGSSSSGTESNDSDSCNSNQRKDGRCNTRRAHNHSQALLQRLRAVINLLQELDTQGARLTAQLQDGQTRLMDICMPASGSGIALPRDEGLAAAATAGLAAALSAAAGSYAARVTELRQRLRAINKAPVSAMIGGAGQTMDPEREYNARWTASQHLGRAASDAALAGAAVRSTGAAAVTSSTLAASGSARDMLGADGVLFGRTGKTQFSAPSMTAGTTAVKIGSPSGHTPFANIGGRTSLSKASFTSTLAGLQLPVTEVGTPTAAAAAIAVSPKPTLLLSPKATSIAPGAALTSSSAADAGAVHQRLADLSRQASRISERASVLLSSNVSGRSSPGEAAAAVGSTALARTGLLTRSLSMTSSTSSRPGSPSAVVVPALASSFTKPATGLLGLSGHATSKASSLLSSNIGSSSSLLNRPASTSPRWSGLALLDRSGSASGAVTGTGGIAAVSSKLNSLSQKWGNTAASSSLLKPAAAWPL